MIIADRGYALPPYPTPPFHLIPCFSLLISQPSRSNDSNPPLAKLVGVVQNSWPKCNHPPGRPLHPDADAPRNSSQTTGS